MITVEQISESDLMGLKVLYEQLVPEETDYNKMIDTFAWMKSNPDYIVLAAKIDGEVVGSLMGIVCRELRGQCRPFMIIENVIVLERFRHMGVGRKLFQAIEDAAREKGCYLIQFLSSIHRKEAHQFYEALGYGPDVARGFRKFL